MKIVRKFELGRRREQNVVILSPIGYLEAEGGKVLKTEVDKFLQEGVNAYIFDFQKTELISSPGVAALLDVASNIVDDFDGSLASFGLDKHHDAVLEMAGFFFLAIQAENEQAALAAVRD